MAALSGLIVSEVYPQTWKKAMGVSAAKGTSLRKAAELWPAFSAIWTKRTGSVYLKHDRLAEAALIARFGLNTVGCSKPVGLGTLTLIIPPGPRDCRRVARHDLAGYDNTTTVLVE